MENQLAIEGLRVKLNEISNAIRGCEQQIARLMADKATIQAALKVMGSDSNRRSAFGAVRFPGRSWKCCERHPSRWASGISRRRG
jgi:hypothetical protein